MSETIKLAAFCGSLRKASFNRLALKAFAERLPPGTTLSTIEIGDWPLYDADVQAQGFPVGVQAAQKAMLEADGIVFATPEYNYSVSGVLKNAIDWLSRMTPQPFAGKPIAMFGAAGGPLGTANSELYIASYRAYNRWLADFCNYDKNRLAGVAYIPMRDIDESLELVREAVKLGHRSIIPNSLKRSAMTAA